MTSVLFALSVPAYALDCTGRQADACDATNAVVAQINMAAGYPVLDEANPSWYAQPQAIYDRFVQETLPMANAACGPNEEFRVEGTLGGYWDTWYSDPGSWHGAWGDLDGPAGGNVNMGYSFPGAYWGFLDGPGVERFSGNFYFAFENGSTLEVPAFDGWAGGFLEQLGNHEGYIANLYGSCGPAIVDGPDVAFDVLGNVEFVAGWPDVPFDSPVEAPEGLFGAAADERVLTVSDGQSVCSDDTAPFECTTALGGLLLVNEDGSFAYLAPTGSPNGTVDHFDVIAESATSGVLTRRRVELTQSARVWFVDGGSGGDGSRVYPASSLGAISVDDGDVVVVGGMVDAGTGLNTSGSVRFQGGHLPVVLDLSLNGQTTPTVLEENYPAPTLLVTGHSIVTLDTNGGPGALAFADIAIEGDSGSSGLFEVIGDQPYDLQLDGLDVTAAGTFVVIAQPVSVGDPRTVQISDVRLDGTIRALDITAGGTARHDLSVAGLTLEGDGQLVDAVTTEDAEVHLAVTDSDWWTRAGLSVQTMGVSSFEATLTRVEAHIDETQFTSTSWDESSVDLTLVESHSLGGDVALDFRVRDDSRTGLDLDRAVIDAGRVLHVDNTSFRPGSASFGGYVTDTELSGGFNGASSIELYAAGRADTRIAMANTLLHHVNPQPAFVVRSAHLATTSVVLHDNEFEALRTSLTMATLDHSSAMCLEAQDNRFRDEVQLSQRGGSDFSIAGLPLSYTSAPAVEHYVRSRNLYSDVEVQQGGGATVDYSSTSGCALP